MVSLTNICHLGILVTSWERWTCTNICHLSPYNRLPINVTSTGFCLLAEFNFVVVFAEQRWRTAVWTINTIWYVEWWVTCQVHKSWEGDLNDQANIRQVYSILGICQLNQSWKQDDSYLFCFLCNANVCQTHQLWERSFIQDFQVKQTGFPAHWFTPTLWCSPLAQRHREFRIIQGVSFIAVLSTAAVSLDVAAEACLLSCDKAEVFRQSIKETLCTRSQQRESTMTFARHTKVACAWLSSRRNRRVRH